MKKQENIQKMDKIVIQISNNTDEKLFNVPILCSSEEQISKISYASGITDILYQDYLNLFKKEIIDIEAIKIVAFGDYRKFVEKQIISPIRFYYPTGEPYLISKKNPTNVLIPLIDQYQYACNQIKLDNDLPFSTGNLKKIVLYKYELDYLMPEISIRIYLHIKSRKSL